MHVVFTGVLLLLCLAVGTGTAEGQTANEFQNPVIRGVNPDPSIVRVGSDYYVVTSSFSYFPGCPIYHSRDLVNWELIGYALNRPSQFSPARNHGHPQLYAATLRYHDGRFYVITTDVNGGGNFYVWATNPAGPWSEPVYVDQGQFDPSLFFDDDGKVYYTRRGPFSSKDIVQAEIDIKTGRLLTPLRSIGKGMVSDDAEGPHLYKANGWYYLSEAEGGARFLHMETVGRSRSPWGPFAPSPGNPWLSQLKAYWNPVKSAGHADLVDTPDGHWWAVYLATRHADYGAFSLGRETFLAPVTWRDGWPTVKQQDISQLTVHEPTLPLHPWPAQPERDDFDNSTLGLQWELLTLPSANEYSLTERPGYLRLHGLASPPGSNEASAFVARRQTEWQGSVSTRMEFSPAKANEEAGLIVYMSDKYHYEIYKSLKEGQPVIELRKVVGDISVVTATVPVAAGPVWLKVEFDPARYNFFYATKQGEWKPLGSGIQRLIASEVADVWTGMMLGMYSTGNGQASTTPADFDWFDYKATYVPVKPVL